MLVWGGGADAGTPIADGARYDPLRDAWRPMTTTGAPGSAERAAFTCGRLVAWGGGTTSGGVYDPVSDVWTPTANAAGVYAHADFPLVPTGNTVLAWSGSSAADTTNTGASYCVCASQPLPGSPWVVVDRASNTTSRVAWEVLPQATSYDLVRGSLAALRSTNGSFGASTTGCLANDSTTSAYDDAAPPDDGGSWYLVRANSAAGAGSYDDGSPSQSGSRDPGVAASGAACP